MSVQQLALFNDHNALPVIRYMEVVDGQLPTYRCPACRKHPQSWGSDPVDEDGVTVGWVTFNGCCRFTWFRPADSVPKAGVLA